ncbi:Arginine biosynthesis bifunctional protein ArgJ, chloroplastic [Quillaja saponaria]|uniref:Arginine biosynthesis bifunctional protein ArgJ, chloroplastic n=1 Tax=Quillaja saponaria TaxID=32244 RepID=A0AAD7LJX5_QUISA|nr:Arginine biosynthesis bifunctional protein ArgJ, chloroplastic [Quillaja saponaria]
MDWRVCAVPSSANQASDYLPAAPIFLPEGPWKLIPGGVTAAEGFKAAGIYGGLRAKGEKPDLALVTCDVDGTSAGVFTTNMVAAAPVLYCKRALDISKTIGGAKVRVGGMAKGSGMIHPNMAAMLGVITTDALVASDVWRKIVQVAVNRSFNQITVCNLYLFLEITLTSDE